MFLGDLAVVAFIFTIVDLFISMYVKFENLCTHILDANGDKNIFSGRFFFGPAPARGPLARSIFSKALVLLSLIRGGLNRLPDWIVLGVPSHEIFVVRRFYAAVVWHDRRIDNRNALGVRGSGCRHSNGE